MYNSKMYIPRAAIIEDIEDLTYDTKLFKLKFKHKYKCDAAGESDYKPGQFVQASVLGAGEAPISLCSSPTQNGCFELCVRGVGLVTGAMHRLGKGDEIGIRGPYGNSFPIEKVKGQDFAFIAGGIGLAPLSWRTVRGQQRRRPPARPTSESRQRPSTTASVASTPMTSFIGGDCGPTGPVRNGRAEGPSSAARSR